MRQLGHKVVDVFSFLNEFELLELRLRMLSPFVDFFVLVECNKTFSGRTKPLYFSENSSRFEEWKDKIIVHIVNDPIMNRRDLQSRLRSADETLEDKWILKEASDSPLTKGAFHWTQEFYQKESARKAIPPLADDDLVFYGDLDEIWNPTMTFEWNNGQIFKLKQVVFQYWMNNQSSDTWSSAFFTAARNIQHQSLQEIRSKQSGVNIVEVPFGGWHFTFQGGAERVRFKIESYGHQEFNKRRFKSRIRNRIASNRDVFNRNIQFTKDESKLPLEVLRMRSFFPDWFL